MWNYKVFTNIYFIDKIHKTKEKERRKKLKEKKNIIILAVTIIIFCIALIFFMWTLKKENTNEEEKIENTIEAEEISKTKDLDADEYIDFTFYKEDRSEVKLSDFKDKATMVLFWNSDVEDSVAVLKKVNELYEKYSSSVNFVMINTSQEVNEQIKQEVSMEIYYDFYKEGTTKYRIEELPSMLYIKEDNKIFNAKSGLTSTDALDANLEIISNNI